MLFIRRFLLLLVLPVLLVCDEVDLVVFSYDRPMQLYATLESVEKHVQGLHNTHVIYRCRSAFDEGYELVKQDFPNVHYFQQHENNADAHAQFKPLVMQLLFSNESRDVPFIVFSTDDIIIKDTIDLQYGIAMMKETGARGFFYRLGRNITHCYAVNKHSGVPPLTKVGEDTYLWTYRMGKYDWQYPSTVDFTLYEKATLEKKFASLSFHHPNSFEGTWARQDDLKGTGLCSKVSKIVNIPMNVVSGWNNRQGHIYTEDELYDLFLKGQKIDIVPIGETEHDSAHSEITPTFIPR